MLFVALAACAPRVAALPRTRGTTAWEVGVAAAIGDGVVEERYTLRSEPVKHDVWALSTVRSEVLVVSPDGTEQRWSSDARTPGDPWPLVLQHAVASVPALVRMSRGRPVEILSTDDWAEEARAAMAATSLPEGAVATGANLVDPEGLLLDLGRAFPGMPDDGRLVAADRIAGVPALREETCAPLDSPGVLRFRCTGTATATDGSNRLHDVDTWTELVADRDGMVWMESAYGGTLRGRGGTNRGAVAVAGHRRVERR
ncbi:MAG: hypothetical protein H6735_17880 [Alphaproteobacteria bacterium]|nr:hypothetical protein [Alphaproteobacteria bacterium]